MRRECVDCLVPSCGTINTVMQLYGRDDLHHRSQPAVETNVGSGAGRAAGSDGALQFAAYETRCLVVMVEGPLPSPRGR